MKKMFAIIAYSCFLATVCKAGVITQNERDIVYNYEIKSCECVYKLIARNLSNLLIKQGVNIQKFCQLTKTACLKQKNTNTLSKAAKIISNYGLNHFECSDENLTKSENAWKEMEKAGISLDCPSVKMTDFIEAAKH